MTISKIIFLVVSVLLFLYLILPQPDSITDFPALPNSVKSKLEGDTIQVPNVAGYFSNNYRDFATKFYQDSFQSKTFFPFPPFRLNYPPEFAYTAIKDQTQSTYLEEYVYPLRGSLYVNGLEPFEHDMTPRWEGATFFELPEGNFQTKVTLRYYPSPLLSRIIVWIGLELSILALFYVSKRVINER